MPLNKESKSNFGVKNFVSFLLLMIFKQFFMLHNKSRYIYSELPLNANTSVTMTSTVQTLGAV